MKAAACQHCRYLEISCLCASTCLLLLLLLPTSQGVLKAQDGTRSTTPQNGAGGAAAAAAALAVAGPLPVAAKTNPLAHSSRSRRLVLLWSLIAVA